MAGALIGLQALLGVSGVFLFFDGPIALSVLLLAAGLLLGSLAVSLRSGEVAHAWNASRAIMPLLVLPVVLMAMQCIPLPSLANSVWSTAAAALNEPLSGSITIDVGATVVSLARYLALAAIVIVALCVAVNRRHVEALLRVLIAVAVVFCIVLLVATAVAPKSLVPAAHDFRTPLTAIASLGMLLGATSIVRWVEQREISRGKGAPGPLRGHSDIVASSIALAICAAIVAAAGSKTAWLGVFCALLPLLSVPLVRRFISRPAIMRGVMGFIVLFAVVLLAIQMLQGSGNEPAVRIAAGADAAQVGLAQRMLADAPRLGSGAGTYSAMAPVYRSLADPASALVAPTAAAALEQGLGASALVLFTVLALAAVALLFDRALRRGRDSFYPALGGGCLLLVTFGMFVDNALLGTTVAVLSAAIVGLAFGQSLSMRQMLE